ncbi:MAG: hypothetical protein COA52_00655 [Hyphomicrobiales bacterium]|nr:MAG: hypothetical protein COA52_00655 [Hyphomicrobiales bacterium]
MKYIILIMSLMFVNAANAKCSGLTTEEFLNKSPEFEIAAIVTDDDYLRFDDVQNYLYVNSMDESILLVDKIILHNARYNISLYTMSMHKNGCAINYVLIDEDVWVYFLQKLK